MPATHSGPSVGGILFPFLTFLTILLSVTPFVWHVKNRNLAASSLIFWIVLDNIFYFVNALIWSNDDMDSWWRGYGLCDLEVKLQVAVTIGIPASLVCIMRNLARVLDTDRTIVQPTPAQRTRQNVIESLLCFGVPIYMTIIHYVVQNVRYYIFAISGCVPGFDNSWPTVVLIEIWSPFFSVVAVYYSIIVVLRIHKYRKDFAAVISASSSGITKSRFLRLFFMSLTLVVLGLPVQFYVLYKNTTYPSVPYSWSRIHGPGWWDIILVPTEGAVSFDRWIQLAVGFTIFAFFGLGHDMKKMYRKWLLTLGFGRFFPSLDHSEERLATQTSSYSSRAHVFLKGKFNKASRSSSSQSATASETQSSLATFTDFRRPSFPLDSISEKSLDPVAENSFTGQLLSPGLSRFATLAHLSGPYSSIRALSLFARPSHGVPSPHPSDSKQAAGLGQKRTDGANPPGCLPIDKAEV